METWVARPRVRNLAGALLVFAVALAVFLPSTTRDGVQTNDTRGAAVAAYLFVETGTFAFPEHWPDDHAYWTVERVDGAFSVNRMPGVIATGIPAYAIARLLGVTPRLTDVPHPVFVPYAPAAFAAAIVTAAALAVLFCVLVRVASRRDALIAALVLAFTTPLFSVAADALWPHATTALALAVMLLANRQSGATAVSSALAVVTRPHLAVVPGVIGLCRLRNRRMFVAYLLGSFAGLALLVAYSYTLFGTVLPAAGYETSGFLSRLVTASPVATAENIGQAWFNRERGIALHTPYLLLLLPAVWHVWRDAPAFTKRAFLAGAVYFVVQMRMARASGGSGFAQWRTSLEMLVLWAPLMVYAATTYVRARPVYWLLLMIAIVTSAVITVVSVIDGGRSDWAYTWWAEQQQLYAPA